MRCPTISRACRTVATATVLLLGVGLVPQIASAAGLHGRATGTGSVTAGTWGVHAATTSFTFTSTTDQTVTVTNSGTIALSAESYGVTISKPSTGTPTFKLFECTTAWSANKCAGGAGTQIGGTLNSNSSTTVSISTALAVSAAIYLQWEPTGVTSSTAITLSPQVTSPTQLRASVKTNQ